MSDQLKHLVRATGATVVIAIVAMFASAVVSPVARAIPARPKPMTWVSEASDTKPMEDDYLNPPTSSSGPTRRDAATRQVIVSDATTKTTMHALHVFVLRSLFNFLPR